MWPLIINGEKVCTQLDQAIKEARHAGKVLKYWEEKGRFGNGKHDNIDWDIVGIAMSAVTRTRRQWVTKHCSGFCATGKMMHRWGKRTSAKCPRCDLDKDAAHVWKCRGSGADDIRTKAMDKLKKELVTAHTLPNLAEVLRDRLTAWQSNSAPTVPFSNFLGLRTTIEDQDRVGWQAMLEGMPVFGWEEVQQRYLVWRKKRSTGKRWLLAIIQNLWDIAWDLWDHRNNILHDTDTNLAEQQQNKELEEEFNKGPNTVTREAKLLFRQGLGRLLALPPSAKQAWLIRIRNARVRYAELQMLYQPFADKRRGMELWLHAYEDVNHRRVRLLANAQAVV